MGRSVYRMNIACSREQAYERAVNLLKSDGYRIYDHHGEQVWKMGTGLATAMHYIKVSFPSDSEIQLAGWIQVGVGRAGFNDADLHGKVAAVIPKKSVKKTLAKVASAVSSDPQVLKDPFKYIDNHDLDPIPDMPSYEDMMMGIAPAPESGSADNRADAPSNAGSGEIVRFCPECGNRITIDAGRTKPFIFCNACGHKIDL